MVTTGTMKIVRSPLVREALEWTGDNLLVVQQFMQPHSPLFFQRPVGDADKLAYGPSVPTLTITTRNLEHELKYPTLGRQYSTVEVRPGDWIYREGESFAVVRKGEFDAEWAPQVVNPIITG